MQDFMATAQTWTPLLLVLEKRTQHDRVDKLLTQMWANKMIDHVLLSGLIDSAGQAMLWSRADRLWHRFTNRYRVQPDAICYAAFAKAHLLSGRPAAAVQILHNLDSLNIVGKDEVAANAAIICLQALAIVYHSSTSQKAKNDLLQYLNKKCVVSAQSTAEMKNQWSQLYCTSKRLVSIPLSVLFHDLLHYDNGQETKQDDALGELHGLEPVLAVHFGDGRKGAITLTFHFCSHVLLSQSSCQFRRQQHECRNDSLRQTHHAVFLAPCVFHGGELRESCL